MLTWTVFVRLGDAQILDANSAKLVSKGVDSLNLAAEKSIESRQYQDAKKFAGDALDIAKKINYLQGTGASLIILSSIAYDNRNFIEAEELGKEAENVLKPSGADSLVARAYVVWGQAVWAQSRFDDAINSFANARLIFIRIQDTIRLGSTNSLLALAEEERGNYEKSFQYALQAMQYKDQGAFVAIGQLYADVGDYDAALDYYTQVSVNRLHSLIYLKAGEALFLKKNYDSSLYFYRQYVNELSTQDIRALAKPYVLMGELFVATKQYDSALFFLQNALAGFKEVNDRNWIMRTLLELAKASKEMNKATKALAYSRELLTNAEQTGAKQYERDAHYLLFELYASLQQSDSAFAHLRNYTSLNNAIAIDMSARKLGFYKASAQLEQAQSNIDLLNRQKQLQQEELSRTSLQRTFLIIGVIALIVIFTFLARNILLKRKNEAHLRQLAENELQIQKLENAKKLSELEMQVLRVQMNPHFIFNSINSINRFIMRDDRTDASEYLTKFSRLVRMILQNSQSSLITLENELDSLKLYLELEMLRFEYQFSYKIRIDDEVDISMSMVPPLIIQPFVENAIWHGLMPKRDKGHIDIHIAGEKGYLAIRIADDGIGRPASAALHQVEAATHRSLGLEITSQRIMMVNPEMTSTQPLLINDLTDPEGRPCGTEVVIKLPVRV
jgi:tetratricopeptide (TPR) repeat protein